MRYGQIDTFLPQSDAAFGTAVRFAGVDIVESRFADLAVRTVFKVVLTNPRARRKRYTVQQTKEPCILSIRDPFTGRQTLIVHPSLFGSLKAQVGDAIGAGYALNGRP